MNQISFCILGNHGIALILELIIELSTAVTGNNKTRNRNNVHFIIIGIITASDAKQDVMILNI